MSKNPLFRRSGALTALTLFGLFALTGCEEPQTPSFVSAGSNGFVYLSPEPGEILRDGAESGITRKGHADWYNPELEELRWGSSWGADKPWCSLIGPNHLVNWKAQVAKGVQKPKPRLRCLNMRGEALASVELPQAFNQASIDPSGKSVVLFSNDERGTGSNLVMVGNPGGPEVFFNRKLAAVVDLDGARLRTLTLEGFGASVKSLRFPEYAGKKNSVLVDGKERRLALFLADKEAILIDLNDPQLSQVAVATQVRAGDQWPLIRVIPSTQVFPDPAVLIASLGPDIEQLRLRSREERPEALDLDYSILTTQSRYFDLQEVEIDNTPWLLGATDRGLGMVNLKSAEETILPDFGQIRRLDAYTDAGGRLKIAAWAPGQNAQLATIDPAMALTSLGRTPSILKLGQPIRRLLWVGPQKVAILGKNSLTLIDLGSGKQTPLGGLDSVKGMVYPSGDYLYLVLESRKDTNNQDSLARINLNSMAAESYPLDAFVPGGGSESGALHRINGGEGLLIRQYDSARNKMGVGYIRANAASLDEYQNSFFDKGAE